MPRQTLDLDQSPDNLNARSRHYLTLLRLWSEADLPGTLPLAERLALEALRAQARALWRSVISEAVAAGPTLEAAAARLSLSLRQLHRLLAEDPTLRSPGV